MRRAPEGYEQSHRGYVRACAALERAGRGFGFGASRTLAKAKRGSGEDLKRLRAITADLESAGIRCSPEMVLAAANSSATLAAATGAAIALFCIVCLDPVFQVSSLVVALASPVLSYRCVIGFPASRAGRRASELLKHSSEAVNLMVMDVRQDSSLPRAIMFAGHGESVFARELRRCTWEVVAGTHTSFEEALHALGSRWERFSADLKTALNAIVVASHEATEEGKRRSLGRANTAMVSGAKRRIEEYALSLSTPSMLLFGLGILLPIMVGSFMPMLSWDIWSGVPSDGPANPLGGLGFETAAVMDVVFPAIAFLVATEAVSRRPVDRRGAAPERARNRSVWLVAVAAGVACAGCACALLGTGDNTPAVLLAGTVPSSLTLTLYGRRARALVHADEAEAQDLLFRVGARMLDGDNFESALHKSSQGQDRPSLGRRLCLKAFVMGEGLDGAVSSEARGERVNALEALRVVGRASTKDEAAAGMLAMDLATYLRELSEIESTLKMRLRPTISMMRMTAHFLGPLVLGVTFAIYVSLGSVAGGEGSSSEAFPMLFVLGLFLAEMNAVVCYFVWGIEGGADAMVLARSTGTCLLVSQAVFASAAMLAV